LRDELHFFQRLAVLLARLWLHVAWHQRLGEKEHIPRIGESRGETERWWACRVALPGELLQKRGKCGAAIWLQFPQGQAQGREQGIGVAEDLCPLHAHAPLAEVERSTRRELEKLHRCQC